MTLKNTTERFGSLSIGLHWAMAILIAAVFATIELRELFPKGSDPREMLKSWHFMLGLLVFLLVMLRIGVRLSNPTPAIVPEPSKWQKLAASGAHGLLYLFMFFLPLAGWLILSAKGKPVPFFGLELPPLIGANKDLAHSIEEIHEFIGTAGYYLIGLHASAALFHHYFVKDNTLLRMLPHRD